jgi:hypothetical protein
MTMQPGPVERAVSSDLAERASSGLGQAALVLARELDRSEDASMATVARELRLLLVEIDRLVPAESRSDLDDLRARRAAREASG